MDSKTYNKKSLVKKVSSKLNMSKSESIILVDCVLDSFKEIFFEDGNQKRIEIRNFGISNESAWGLSKFQNLCIKNKIKLYSQEEYSLINRNKFLNNVLFDLK